MTLKVICSCIIARNFFHFTNFAGNMFLLCVRKRIYVNGAVPFLDAQELHSWSTLKANVCIFLYISIRNFLFQRSSMILFSGNRWGVGDGWIIFLRRIVVWVSSYVIQFFIQIEIFRNLTIFHTSTIRRLSLPLCYSLNLTRRLWNEKKEDFLHIWLL